MVSEKYSVQQYTVSDILGFIKSNTIAVPEIQRPFVWKRVQVRDLIDSLYNGYPTGYLILWQNPSVRLKNGEMSGNKKTLIDGQQRVTALMAAIVGKTIIDEDYNKKRIMIAFNPFPEPGNERFEVQDSSHLKSKKWIPDISVLFSDYYNSFSFIPEYIKDNPEVKPEDLNTEIEKLRSILNLRIGVIELVPDLDIDVVTEIFVRINSKGTVLKQTDFIMSKISANTSYGGEELRKTVDYFCHMLMKPDFVGTIEDADPDFYHAQGQRIKWVSELKDTVFRPDYGDVIRTAFMYKYGKGKMADLVSLLSGRNFETKVFEESITEDTFKNMISAVDDFVDMYSFKDFLLCITSTGFENPSQITSDMNIDFAYALYLLASRSDMPKPLIRPFVGRWFVMSTLTGRYTSSPESKMDRDLRMLKEKGFMPYLLELEGSELSESFWDSKLVQDLDTNRYSNPAYYTYVAAQMYNKESSLFTTNIKVCLLAGIDAGDVHHIFPQAYLKRNGFTSYQYNQVANFAYIDKKVNIAISDRAPNEYFSAVADQCDTKNATYGDIVDTEELRENLSENCIPPEIFSMDCTRYEEFLLARRKLMAKKIKDYYMAIKSKC